LRKPRGRQEAGIGAGFLIVIILLLVTLIVLAFKIFSREAPVFHLAEHLRAIGQSSELHFEVSDAHHRIKSLTLVVAQNGKSFNPPVQIGREASAPHAWWRFWSARPASRWMVTAHIGREGIPELKEGRATVTAVATDDSWARFFRGGQSELYLEVPVRLTPPQVEVLTTENYVAQGGTGLVVFKISAGTVSSGVRLGNYLFPSWPVKASQPDTRLCLYAFPYDMDPRTPVHVIAQDDAGNEAVAGFPYRVFPQKFHSSTIPLSDDFLNRVVPAIMSQTPQVEDQGSVLKNFLEINSQLRQIDAQLLVAYSRKTADHFLWSQPFLRLAHAATEASFADRRTYVYQGKVVDHETHLGFDLASVEHAPVKAANDGVVVMARYFGIYGNAIVIDHGCGLQSLYGHLESFAVKVGDQVQRGQLIGHTDSTGLAGGDHLHFTMLVDGIPVNPIEWWDPHWIKDRIDSKLAAYR
jgi:hypothetical protein